MPLLLRRPPAVLSREPPGHRLRGGGLSRLQTDDPCNCSLFSLPSIRRHRHVDALHPARQHTGRRSQHLRPAAARSAAPAVAVSRAAPQVSVVIPSRNEGTQHGLRARALDPGRRAPAAVGGRRRRSSGSTRQFYLYRQVEQVYGGPGPSSIVAGERQIPGRARDLGARAAQGAQVVFLDGRCFAPPGWLAGLVAPLADPGIGLVGCAFADLRRPFPASASVRPGARRPSDVVWLQRPNRPTSARCPCFYEQLPRRCTPQRLPVSSASTVSRHAQYGRRGRGAESALLADGLPGHRGAQRGGVRGLFHDKPP